MLYNRIILKRLRFIIPTFYVLTWLFLYISNYKSYGFISSLFDKNIVKIHTHLQVITGPMHYIDDKIGIKLLIKNYPNLSDYDIELLGNTPYNHVKDPAEIGNLTVYGHFKGSTNRYRNIGYDDIPVFEVKYYDYPSIQLSSHLYTFPIFVIIFMFPISILIEIIVLKKLNKTC